MGRELFRDERGFTTTSMVLSLLITLSLVFTTAQVYRIGSASAEVQDVADAAALAAETQISEFMIIARFCDAIVLSLSLTGLAVTGLGLVALCTPVTAPASEVLIDAGKQIMSTRNRFSERAASVLNKLQEALPFLAAAAAANVSIANNRSSSGSNYLGIAILAPSKAEKIELSGGAEAEELVEDVDDRANDIREKAKQAEEASQEADRAKERAFMRDCGDNPDYCMYERAGHLAGLSGGDNPLYTSIEPWSFAVALNRARAYYRLRRDIEAPADYSIEEQARSALRERFFRYAVDELDNGYVIDTEERFEANIPHLPSNTDEMRLTWLYDEEIYPISEAESGALVMHAWAGCPEAAATLARGSIAEMENGDFETCPTCEFTAASLGRVAAASSSIPNGFEYHYEAVADEAIIYERARQEASVPKSQVMSEVGQLLEQLLEAARKAAGMRINVSPPGRFGAIALVVNVGRTPAAGPFSTTFVRAADSLGPRAAVSASTLVDEGTQEGRSAVSALLDGVRGDGGTVAGAAGMVLDAWSWMLVAYADGQDALITGVEQGLNGLPLASSSGLGTWAAERLSEAIEDVGLQPAEVGALKPVLINSFHVAAKGDTSFSSGLLSVKKQVVAHPLMSTSLFSSLLTEAERTAIEQVGAIDDTIEVASIELFGDGGPSIPVTIPLPPEVKGWAVDAISGLFARIRSLYAEVSEERVWE